MKHSKQEDFDTIIREGLKPSPLPPHLRERVLQAIAVEARGARASRWLKKTRNWKFAMAGAFVALALSIVLGRSFFMSETHAWTEDLISDYFEMMATSEPEQIATSSTQEIERWFSGKLPFMVSVPPLKDAEIMGARLCELKSGKAGLIFYEVNGAKASLFVLNAKNVRLHDLEPLNDESQELRGTSARGVNLLSWEKQGIVYALVSGLDRSTLVKTVNN